MDTRWAPSSLPSFLPACLPTFLPFFLPSFLIFSVPSFSFPSLSLSFLLSLSSSLPYNYLPSVSLHLPTASSTPFHTGSQLTSLPHHHAVILSLSALTLPLSLFPQPHLFTFTSHLAPSHSIPRSTSCHHTSPYSLIYGVGSTHRPAIRPFRTRSLTRSLTQRSAMLSIPLTACFIAACAAVSYTLQSNISGSTFFDNFDFWNIYDPTYHTSLAAARSHADLLTVLSASAS